MAFSNGNCLNNFSEMPTERLDGQTDGWMDGRLDRSMNGWMEARKVKIITSYSMATDDTLIAREFERRLCSDTAMVSRMKTKQTRK